MRPTYEGLQIAPVIPADWPGFNATRLFRGVTYQIEVVREGTGNAVALTVDGVAVAGNVVPLPGRGTESVSVRAVLK